MIAFPRPGSDSVSQNLDPDLAEHVREIPGRPMDISGTEIRDRVADGRSIRYLAPPEVKTFIAEHGLYTGRHTRRHTRRHTPLDETGTTPE